MSRTSPYQGLIPFGEDDAAYFFGRDTDREIVIDNLRAYRLSILYGPSGVGKSSLLHAGVAYDVREHGRRRLAEGRSPEYVVAALSSWTGDPVAGLKEAIRSALEQLSPELAAPLPDGSLAEVIAAAADRIDGSLLSLLDQFEDHFLYHEGESGPGSFADEFASVLARSDVPVSFLISIREDAFAKLDRFEGRIPNLLDNLLRIDHLGHAAAREAIEGPIQLWNQHEPEEGKRMRIEPELVEAVLSQVEIGKVRIGRSSAAGESEPSDARHGRIQTPYLQLVLIRLWDEEVRAGSRVLRLETLERLGGSERIVATHLDAAMETLSLQEQGVAAKTFRYLVTPSGTKISQSSKDLAEYADLPEAAVAPVLERLAGEARILQPAGDSRYEIYHDALAAPILEWRGRWEGRKLRRREQMRLFTTVCLAAGALALVAFASGIRDVELAALDARFELRGSSQPPSDVLLVAIDDRTFSELRNVRFPIPRSMHGRLIDRLSRAGAKVIAYNIQFTEETSIEEDSALVQAVARAGKLGSKVVLATTEVDQSGQSMIFGGESVVRELGARSANTNLELDSGGTVRRMRYRTQGLKTFPVVSAEAALGRTIRSSELGGRSAWIDFVGPHGSFQTVSFSRAMRGAVGPEAFRGKVVVVGATAPSLQDIHDTPVGSMSGIEAQANGIVTALRGFPLKNLPGALNLVLIVLLGLVAPLVSLRFSRFKTLLVALAAAGLYIGIAQVAFELGWVLLVAYPVGALVFSTLAVLVLGGAAGGRRMRGSS